jgi:hypothetical protein
MVSTHSDNDLEMPLAEDKRRTTVYFENGGVDIPDGTKAEAAFSMLIEKGAPAYYNPDMNLSSLRASFSEAVYFKEFKDIGVICEEQIRLIDLTGAVIDKKLIYRGVDRARGLSIQTRLFMGSAGMEYDYASRRNMPTLLEDKRHFEYLGLLNLPSEMPTILLNTIFTNDSLDQCTEDVLGPNSRYVVKPLVFSGNTLNAYVRDPHPGEINYAAYAFKDVIDSLDQNKDQILSASYFLNEGIKQMNTAETIRKANEELCKDVLGVIEENAQGFLKEANDKIRKLNLPRHGLEKYLVNLV